MNAVPIAAQPSPSAAVVEFLKRKPRLLIGGEWVESRADVRRCHRSRHGQTRLVDRGRRPGRCRSRGRRGPRRVRQGPWPDMLPAQREALLWKLSDLIEANADELAELESIDNGKTRFMARIIDVPGTRDYFRYMAGWATKIEGRRSTRSSSGRARSSTPTRCASRSASWRRSCRGISRWRSRPGSSAPALATGCTCCSSPPSRRR